MRPGEIGDTTIAGREMFDDAPASGIGQRSKRSVELFRRTFNHMVNY